MSIKERDMADLSEWEAAAKRLIRVEMTKHDMSYAKLVEKLKEIGVKEDERNLRNKVARGKFTTAFLLQCLSAMGAKELRL